MRFNHSETGADYSTRRKRKGAVASILASLSAIRDSEKRYLDNVPDNFQNSESFEVGECAVDALGEILDLLADVY
jgi:hypothetical protein